MKMPSSASTAQIFATSRWLSAASTLAESQTLTQKRKQTNQWLSILSEDRCRANRRMTTHSPRLLTQSSTASTTRATADARFPTTPWSTDIQPRSCSTWMRRSKRPAGCVILQLKKWRPQATSNSSPSSSPQLWYTTRLLPWLTYFSDRINTQFRKPVNMKVNNSTNQI